MVQVFFILILSAPGVGAFSGDFTTNLALQCRAFSGALKIEKLKAPLFRGPEGAGATNDWCIICIKKIKPHIYASVFQNVLVYTENKIIEFSSTW